MSLPEPYARRLHGLGASTLQALEGLEVAARRLHPPQLDRLRQGLAPLHERLAETLAAFRDATPPEEHRAFHAQLVLGAEHAEAALARFCAPAPPGLAAAGILEGLRLHCRAQEALYPLRIALPPLAAYFVEPGFRARGEALDPEPHEGLRVGLQRAAGTPDERGGFSLYVPEWYDGSTPWPLVVALHGGFGAGRDFLFTWLREARGRGFLLLAPTSLGSTWSLDAPGIDQGPLFAIVRHVTEHWNVDRERVMATGLSDGATFTLLVGLAEGSPFTHLAPVSGVLHPANFSLGNLTRAAGRRIRLVHGAMDWLFPVSLARAARDELEAAGADLVYREIADLSHAYPREENVPILEWLASA